MKIEKFMRKCFLIIFLFTMYAYAKEPSWVYDSNSIYDEYPEDEYIAEIGYGDTVNSAQADAISHISQFFISSVKSNFRDRSEFKSSNVLDVSVVESIVNETYINSQVNLFAVEYSKAYKDKQLKQYCVVAFINRNKAWKIFEPKVSAAATKFEKLYLNASEIEDALDKFMAYKSASLATAEFIECYEFGKKLAPDQCSKYSNTNDTVASLPSVIKKLQNQCKFSVSVEGDNNDVISRKLSNLLNKLDFATQKSDAPYEINAVVTVELRKSDNDYGVTYSVNPGIELTMGKNGNAVFSYSRTLKRVTNFDENKTRIQAYQKIENELDNTFLSDFTAFLDSK